MKLQCTFITTSKLDVERLAGPFLELPPGFDSATINIRKNEELLIQRINSDEILYTFKYFPNNLEGFNWLLIKELAHLNIDFKFCITSLPE
jgi:hypothetical protein